MIRILSHTIILCMAVCLASACAQKRQAGPEGTPPYMFPHPDGWENPAAHGSLVLQYGAGACLKCHRATSSGATSLKNVSTAVSTIPTCDSCHPLYPHVVDWAKKEVHGARVMKDGKADCATQCHGYDLKGGLSGISCNRCHSIYPHGSTWLLPQEHGESAKGDGRELCKGCHGDDLKGGTSGVSCNQCHDGYPHAPGWGSKDSHGKFVSDNGNGTCKTACHGADLKGGLSGISCNGCHTMYPHEGNWEADHGETVLALGKSACVSCHGTDFKTILGGKNCFSCHIDYPHPEDSIWLPYDTGHGKRVQFDYAKDTTECKKCHGGDLKTVLSGRNCFSCHGSYPHGMMPNPPWNQSLSHGGYALLHTRTECQMCHGGPPAPYEGGPRGNDSCYSCHDNYPHVAANWQDDTISGAHATTYLTKVAGGEATACQECHGANYNRTITSDTSRCKYCHANYPHPANWAPPVVLNSLHGPNAIAGATPGISECKLCHGAALDIVLPVAGKNNCADCHASYLRHANANTGFAGWGTGGADQHGKNYILDSANRFLPNTAPYVTTRARAAECRLCHGDGDQEFKGGISGRSCMDIDGGCHTTDKSPLGPSSNDNWPMLSFACSVCHSHGSIYPTNPTCLACHSDVAAGHHSWDGSASCRTAGCHDNIMP